MAKSALKRAKKTVRGKGGKTYQRTVFVRAQEGVPPVGARTMSAKQILKKHGLDNLGRGALHGIGSAAGRIAGHNAGFALAKQLKFPVLHNKRRGTSVDTGQIAGSIFANVGGSVAGHVAGRKVRQQLYRTERGQRAMRDFRQATFGGKMAFGAAHLAGYVAANNASIRAYNHIVQR